MVSDVSQTEDGVDIYLESAIEAVLDINDFESAIEDSATVLDLEEQEDLDLEEAAQFDIYHFMSNLPK